MSFAKEWQPLRLDHSSDDDTAVGEFDEGLSQVGTHVVAVGSKPVGYILPDFVVVADGELQGQCQVGEVHD